MDRISPLYALLWGDTARADATASGLDIATWNAVDRQAMQHRLRPLLHRRALAQAWPVPPDLARQWQASHRRSAMRALAQKAVLARVGKSLAEGGVPTAILKGGTFVWSGAFEPALRPMRDIDLLIRPDDADAASALLRSIGFTTDEKSRPSAKHLPAMFSGNTVLELHLRIFDTHDAEAAARERQFIDRAWCRALPADFPGLQMLCPTDTLLHLILHAVRDHQFNNGPLLLTDMAALVAYGAIDWSLLWDETERIGVTRECQLALGFGERVGGLVVDWLGREPVDLGDAELEQVARLMLVDMTYRSAIGWPGQLLRMSPHRWPAKLVKMVQRRGDDASAQGAVSGHIGLGAALSYAVGAEGRARIADAVRLALWLRRM